MYADDGLVMTAQPFEIDEEDWTILAPYGIKPSFGLKKDGTTQKTGKVQDVFTFLGITYNMKTDVFDKNGLLLRRADLMSRYKTLDKVIAYLLDGSGFIYEDDSEWTEKQNYNETWKWDIVKGSYTFLVRERWYSLYNLACLVEWITGNKGYRRFGWLFVNYIEESSNATFWLLNRYKGWKNSKRNRHHALENTFGPHEFEPIARELRHLQTPKEKEAIRLSRPWVLAKYKIERELLMDTIGLWVEYVDLSVVHFDKSTVDDIVRHYPGSLYNGRLYNLSYELETERRLAAERLWPHGPYFKNSSALNSENDKSKGT